MTKTIKQIEIMVDVKQAASYLRTKDVKPIRGARQNQMDAIHVHAKKCFHIGIFERTASRLLRQRWPEADADLILQCVHTVYSTLKNEDYGKDSLLDKMDRDAALAEEPSDFPASRFEDVPDYEQGWLVDNLIPDDDAILNQGDGGAGKTTTMLQLAVAVATGRPWLGLDTGVIPKHVLFFSCEERTQKIQMRIKPLLYGASSPYNGEVTWNDLDKLHIVCLADRDSLIAIKDSAGRIVATEMFRYFDKKIAEHKPALVIIDSLYDIYGGDENTRAQVRQFVGMVRRFTGKYQCALIVLGHPSLYGMASGSGTSGSTGWRNAFRGLLYTQKSKNKAGVETHKIESKKSNYGEPDAVVNLIWQDGIFIPIEPDQAEPAKNVNAPKLAFLDLLAQTLKEDRAVSHAVQSKAYAPREFSRRNGVSYTEDDFRLAMDSLFEDGAIAVREYRKKDRKLSERLELTGTPPVLRPDWDDAA